MIDANIADEERRLAQHYAQMDEEELEAMAGSAYELTDVARRALQGEISRRGLDFKLLEFKPKCALAPPDLHDEEMDEADLGADSTLVEIRQVSSLEDAHRVEAILDAKWIPYCWGPENLENIDELKSGLSDDGIALKVCRTDLARGISALAELPSEPEEPEPPDYSAVCPKCHSPEIVFQGRQPESATTSEANAKFNWSCDACGYQWQDDGIEHEAAAG